MKMEISVSIHKDFETKKISTSINEDGSMFIKQEDFKVSSGDIIEKVSDLTPSKKENHTNIKLSDGSVIADVPNESLRTKAEVLTEGSITKKRRGCCGGG